MNHATPFAYLPNGEPWFRAVCLFTGQPPGAPRNILAARENRAGAQRSARDGSEAMEKGPQKEHSHGRAKARIMVKLCPWVSWVGHMLLE